jgi:hypothetical protein
VARTQKARLFELRAASSLARLWRDQGRREEARATLEPVYGWFAEGFDMPDLVDARLLLESLKPAADVAKVESCGRPSEDLANHGLEVSDEPVVGLNQRRSDPSGTARGSC